MKLIQHSFFYIVIRHYMIVFKVPYSDLKHTFESYILTIFSVFLFIFGDLMLMGY